MQRLWPLTVIAVALLALGLRLLFSLEYSGIIVVWDAGLYWDQARLVASAPLDHIDLLYNREGVLPLIIGPLISVFPEEPQTVYTFNALLDALACVLVMLAARRLDLPYWTSALAGLLLALHVPAIIGAGAILQQPLIRFALALALYAYLSAFTVERPARWIVLGGAAILLAGFGSVTTRPLIWLVFVTVLLIGWKTPKIRWPQVAVIGVTVTGMALLVMGNSARMDTAMRLFTGLSSSGGAQDQTTVLSFEHFWPPSSWQTVTDNPTESLFSDFASAPIEFAYKSAFSLYANYRYVDTAYMQAFGLSLGQQTLQHLILLALAIVGVAWLSGHNLGGVRGIAALLMLVIALYLSAAFSVISVEPRRLSVLAPYMALGAASGVYMLAKLRPNKALIGVGLALVVVWLLPAGILAVSLGEIGYYVLIAVRLAVTFVFVVIVLKSKTQRAQSTQKAAYMRDAEKIPDVGTRYIASAVSDGKNAAPTLWRMLLLPGFALLTIGIASLQNTNWTEWHMDVTRIQQRVNNIAVPDGLHPWLLLDVKDADQAAMVTITADGEMIKGPGTPMTQWTAGIPPEWSTYETLAQMANTDVMRRYWHAVPVPVDLFADGRLSIEVAAATPFTIYGDFRPLLDTDKYIGPLFSPWYDGNSFWRWQWNTVDPRIQAAQPLFGVDYASSYLDGEAWQDVDDGLYRAFVVMAEIGPQTNAFGAPLAADVDAYCTDDRLQVVIAPQNEDNFHACVDAEGAVYFYRDAVQIGVWTATDGVFNASVDELRVVQVLANTYVANIRDDGEHVYSLVFDLAQR